MQPIRAIRRKQEAERRQKDQQATLNAANNAFGSLKESFQMQIHARVDAEAKEKKNAEADKRARAALTRRAKFLLSEMEKHGKKAAGSSLQS